MNKTIKLIFTFLLCICDLMILRLGSNFVSCLYYGYLNGMIFYGTILTVSASLMFWCFVICEFISALWENKTNKKEKKDDKTVTDGKEGNNK